MPEIGREFSNRDHTTIIHSVKTIERLKEIDPQMVENINKLKNEDYILWIGHATFLIKLGDNMIITDPVFEKNMGPLIFGPKRYVDPAIDLKNLPKIDYFLQTHNHYDHLSTRTIKNFPFKNIEVLSISSLMGEAIKRISNSTSVSDLFK